MRIANFQGTTFANQYFLLCKIEYLGENILYPPKLISLLNLSNPKNYLQLIIIIIIIDITNLSIYVKNYQTKIDWV